MPAKRATPRANLEPRRVDRPLLEERAMLGREILADYPDLRATVPLDAVPPAPRVAPVVPPGRGGKLLPVIQ